MGSGVFLCVSRGGIIAFTVSTLFLIGIARTRRALRSKVSSILAIGIVLTVAVIFSSWERIEGRFQELGQSDRIMRYQVWRDSLDIFREFPFFGTGAGTFEAVFPRYQTTNTTTTFEHAENDYVEVLTDLGLAGLVICLMMLVTYIVEVIRGWKLRKNVFVQSLGLGMLASVVAIVVHSLFDFNLHVSANAMLLSIIAGLSIAIVNCEKRGDNEPITHI
jgi:O-antigen ligase